MTPQELFDMLMAWPQPTRTEILNCTEEITRNYEPERVEALLADFSDMKFYWQCDKTYNRAKWEYDEKERQHRAKYDEVYSAYEKKLHFAEYTLAMGTNEPIEWPEEPEPYEPLPFIPPMPGTIAENIDIPEMYNYAVEVLKSRLTDKFKSPDISETATEAWKLPIELDTPEAKGYFDKLMEAGKMEVNTKGCHWNGPLTELAVTANIISAKLSIYFKWKTFESAFDVNGLAKKYQKALCSKKFVETETRIKEILGQY